MNKKIFAIAGESSGDLQLSTLIKETKDLNISWEGIAAQRCQALGMKILIDQTHLAHMGIVDVLKNRKIIQHAMQTVKEHLKQKQPDAVILVDFPGFNLKIAKYAKSIGLKVFYFISPKVWAWGYYRIKTIKKYVDHMGLILPFEYDLYQKEKIPASLIHHPLLKTCQPKLTTEQFKAKHNLKGKVVTFLPGSRASEIQSMAPLFNKVAKTLHDKYGFNTVCALHTRPENTIMPQCKTVINETIDAIQASEIVIATSGTVTLEAAILNTPVVICYKTHWINMLIAKAIVKIKYIGLANLILNESTCPELIAEKPLMIKSFNKLSLTYNLKTPTKQRKSFNNSETCWAKIIEQLA